MRAQLRNVMRGFVLGMTVTLLGACDMPATPQAAQEAKPKGPWDDVKVDSPPPVESQKAAADRIEALFKQENRPQSGAIPVVILLGNRPFLCDANGNIEQVNLAYTPVTDDDLKLLGSLPAIKKIILTGCSITDAGLAHLEPAKTLRDLSLWGTQVTHEAGDAFRASHPDCEVGFPQKKSN